MRVFGLLLVGACGSPAARPPSNTQPVASNRLVFRHLHTGVGESSTLSTFTLVRTADRVTLVVEEHRTDPVDRATEAIIGWRLDDTTTFTGVATRTATGETLELRAGKATWTLLCKHQPEQVASRSAVREHVPGHVCNGYAGRWTPAATTELTVYVCHSPSEYNPVVEAHDRNEVITPEERKGKELMGQLTFGAPPGIEYLFVKGPCELQGGGLRFVPPDGSIAGVRAPSALKD
jgi:hypothetical protein